MHDVIFIFQAGKTNGGVFSSFFLWSWYRFSILSIAQEDEYRIFRAEYPPPINSNRPDIEHSPEMSNHEIINKFQKETTMICFFTTPACEIRELLLSVYSSFAGKKWSEKFPRNFPSKSEKNTLPRQHTRTENRVNSSATLELASNFNLPNLSSN